MIYGLGNCEWMDKQMGTLTDRHTNELTDQWTDE